MSLQTPEMAPTCLDPDTGRALRKLVDAEAETRRDRVREFVSEIGGLRLMTLYDGRDAITHDECLLFNRMLGIDVADVRREASPVLGEVPAEDIPVVAEFLAALRRITSPQTRSAIAALLQQHGNDTGNETGSVERARKNTDDGDRP